MKLFFLLPCTSIERQAAAFFEFPPLVIHSHSRAPRSCPRYVPENRRSRVPRLARYLPYPTWYQNDHECDFNCPRADHLDLMGVPVRVDKRGTQESEDAPPSKTSDSVSLQCRYQQGQSGRGGIVALSNPGTKRTRRPFYAIEFNSPIFLFSRLASRLR